MFKRFYTCIRGMFLDIHGNHSLHTCSYGCATHVKTKCQKHMCQATVRKRTQMGKPTTYNPKPTTYNLKDKHATTTSL